MLWLRQEQDILCVFILSHNVAIDGPLDVIGCPFNDVLVPICAWLELRAVALVLLLPLPYDIHAHGVICHTRDELDIDLIPAFLSPVGPRPVSEE